MGESSASTATKKKWWKNEDFPSKPWPGPPLAKTIQGKHVHRNINLGELKNAPKPIRNATLRAPAIPEEEEQQQQPEPKEESPELDDSQPPKKRTIWTDLLFMTVLWSWDILHNTMNGLKERYNRDILTWAEEETLKQLTNEELNLFLTVAPMMAMGIVLTFSFNFPILGAMQLWQYWLCLGFLTIYSSGAVAGIILAVKKNSGAAVVLSWVAVGWYTVHPLRFWYIFHQRFPLSVRWSHLVVSGNLLLVGLFDYIVTISVKETRQPYTSTFYVILFGVMTVAAIAWISGTFFVHRYVNEIDPDFESVREVYAETEVIDNFDRRQKFINFLVFISNIIPVIIYPVMDGVFDLGRVKLLQNAVYQDLGWIPYRPDLICFLLVVITVECFLQCLKPIRNELNDLFAIALSHIVNITVLIMFMLILYNTYDYRKRFPDKNEGIVILNGNMQENWFIQIGDEINQLHNALSIMVLGYVPDDTLVPFRAANVSTGKVMFEDNLDIEISRDLSVNGFNLMKYNGSHKLFPIPFPPMTYSYNSRLFIVNGMEECDDYSDEKAYVSYFSPNNTRGVMVNGVCLPLSLVWYEEGSDWEKQTPFKPPANNEISEILEIRCVPRKTNESDSTRLCNKPMVLRMWRLDLYIKKARVPIKNDATISNIIVFNQIKPYQLYSVRLEEAKDEILPFVNYKNVLLHRSEGEQNLLIAMCLYGVALGIGWPSYLHFIWIQSPVRGRMLIIFSFFAMLITAYSLTKRYFTKFNMEDVSAIVIAATVCFVWQVAATVLFVKSWKSFRKTDQPQQPWRRY